MALQRSHSARSFSLMLLTTASPAPNRKVLSYTYSYSASPLRPRINLRCLKGAQWQRPKATANSNPTDSFFLLFVFLILFKKGDHLFHLKSQTNAVETGTQPVQFCKAFTFLGRSLSSALLNFLQPLRVVFVLETL